MVVGKRGTRVCSDLLASQREQNASFINNATAFVPNLLAGVRQSRARRGPPEVGVGASHIVTLGPTRRARSEPTLWSMRGLGELWGTPLPGGGGRFAGRDAVLIDRGDAGRLDDPRCAGRDEDAR
jgi:hypothetical protein